MPRNDSTALLFVGPAAESETLVQALGDVHPSASLHVAESLEDAPAVLQRVPDLLVLSADDDPLAQTQRLARALAHWRVRVPVVVVVPADDPRPVASWYRLGINCVLRVPAQTRLARQAIAAALRYWLEVVALPSEWAR